MSLADLSDSYDNSTEREETIRLLKDQVALLREMIENKNATIESLRDNVAHWQEKYREAQGEITRMVVQRQRSA